QAEDGIRDDLVTGVQTCALPIYHPSKRAEPERLGLLTRRDEQRGRAVVDPRRVPGRHGATVLERWLELSELLDRAARARVLVLADELLAVVHRLDLSGEEPVRLGARVAILAARGVAVLFRAADVLPHRHVLGGLAERDRVIAEVDHPRIDKTP